jgi:hypothetical protein
MHVELRQKESNGERWKEKKKEAREAKRKKRAEEEEQVQSTHETPPETVHLPPWSSSSMHKPPRLHVLAIVQ